MLFRAVERFAAEFAAIFERSAALPRLLEPQIARIIQYFIQLTVLDREFFNVARVKLAVGTHHRFVSQPAARHDVALGRDVDLMHVRTANGIDHGAASCQASWKIIFASPSERVGLNASYSSWRELPMII